MAVPRRIVALALVAGCLACGGFLVTRADDESRLEEAHDVAGNGRYAEAVALARDVGGPAAARAARLEGYALIAQGRFAEAVGPLRRALGDEPNDWRARRDLALALAFTGRRAQARREYEHALGLNPRLPPLRGFLTVRR